MTVVRISVWSQYHCQRCKAYFGNVTLDGHDCPAANSEIFEYLMRDCRVYDHRSEPAHDRAIMSLGGSEFVGAVRRRRIALSPNW